MSCNARKTVCMVVNSQQRSKMLSCSFALFSLGNSSLHYVSSFRYLGDIINDAYDTSWDTEDIQREIKGMFSYECFNSKVQ